VLRLAETFFVMVSGLTAPVAVRDRRRPPVLFSSSAAPVLEDLEEYVEAPLRVVVPS